MAYCNYNKNVSYTQFMAHLVEVLLKYQNDRMCFISLCNILNCELFDMFLNFGMHKLVVYKKHNLFTQVLCKLITKITLFLYDDLRD